MSSATIGHAATDLLKESVVADRIFPCGPVLESELGVFGRGRGFQSKNIHLLKGEENLWLQTYWGYPTTNSFPVC